MRVRGVAVCIFAAAASCVGCARDETEPPALGGLSQAVEASTFPGMVVEPLSFEPNLGMTDPRARFVARSKQTTIYMTDDSLVLVAWEPPVENEPPQGSVIRIGFEGANPSAFEPQAPLAGVSNYFLGSDPSQWQVHGVPRYERVVARNLYPGIDLVVHGNEFQELQYDFVLSAGANPNAISMKIDSAEPPVLDSRRDLRIPAGSGFVMQRAPIVFQEIGGSRQMVSGQYALEGRRVRFELGDYDAEEPLIIDPSISYALVLSPLPNELQVSMDELTVDAAGAVFVTGTTTALDFPPVLDPLQPTLEGSHDAFLTKVAPDGSGLVFSTFFGGGGVDAARDVDVSASGEPVLVGFTNSPDFPIVNAFQPNLAGVTDAFIARFSPSGDQLVYSTYAGGSEFSDSASSVALSAGGDAIVAGVGGLTPPGATFPAAFVTRVSPSGALLFSTEFGEGFASPQDVAVDATGSTYWVGLASAGFSPVNAIQPVFGGGFSDGLIAKFSPSGTVEFATFLGSGNTEMLNRVVAGAGNVHAAGVDQSLNGDILLFGLSSDGATLEYSARLKDLLGLSPDLAPEGGSLLGLYTRGDELIVCGGLPVVSAYPGVIRVPGLLAEHPQGYAPSGFIATVGLDPTRVDSLTAVFDAARCALDTNGNLYLGGPYLEPASPGEEPVRAWVVKLTELQSADDQYEVDEDASLAVSAPGVLANDSPGNAALAQGPVHAASFVLSANGSFSYTPVPQFNGTDTFSYRVEAGGDSSAPATVTLLVRPVPDAPVANGESYVMDAGSQLSVPAPGVLANDSDADGDSLEAVLVSGPSKGSLALQPDGSYIYEPSTGFGGSDSFQYRAFDGTLSSASTTVSIVVNASPTPDTFITSGPAGVANDVTVTFEFSASQPDSGFECSVDGSSFAGCTSPLSLGPLAFAEHRFAVRAVSPGGVADLTPAERVFTVAPDTQLQAAPPPRSMLAAVSFEFASNDPAASFECSFDRAAFASCVSPVEIDPVAEGAHSFSVRAVHGGTLPDPTPATHEFEVDRTAPLLTLVSPLDGAAVRISPTAVTISVNEAAVVSGSSVFSAGTMLPVGTSNATVPLRPGYNTFSTFVRDDLGNSSIFTFHLFLDSTPPALVFLSPPNAASTYHSPIDVLVSLSEDVTIVSSSPGFLSPIGGSLSGGERTLRLSLVSGLNEFSATLRDRAGNETVYSGPSAFSLSLATQHPPAPLLSSPVADTVFSERIAAVAGRAAGNAVRVQITGANTVSVPVTGGNWSGTIRLPEGASRIRAIAYSAAGAASPETSVPVTAGGTRLIAVDSGNEQVGPTGVRLAQPLSVRVTDVSGAPLSGISVTFSLDVEPVTLDGSLGGTGKTATALTDGAGRASVPLTLATSHVNAQGVMQPTLVTATVPSLAGTRAVFAAQGLPVASFGGTGTPTYLIPVGRDCTTAPDRAVGSCPLGPAGSVVSGFTVAVLDETYRLVPDAGVDFTAARGTFGSSATIHLQTGPDGIARSGPFTLSQTIPNPEGLLVMLRSDDLAATPLQIHGVTASLSTLPSVEMDFAAYAHAGPAAKIVDVSPGIIGGWPGIPTTHGLIGRAEDAFGNPVANASLTFTVVPINDPEDPGAKLFRSDTSASSASQCTHVLPKNDDACTVNSLSATTFSAGTAWTQMAMGLRGDTPYQVTASAAAASPVTFTRRSSYVASAAPSSSWLVLQGSATAAATFAIVGTENDDADALTAVTWGSDCSLPAGTPIGQSLCLSPYRDGRTITFEASGDAQFNLPSTNTVVPSGEDRRLLMGGALERALGLTVSFTSSGRTVGFTLAGAQAAPKSRVTIVPVSLTCSTTPRMNARSLCEPFSFSEAPLCKRDSRGVATYIDTTNGYTENNVLVVTVVHPTSSAFPGRLVKKFTQQIQVETTTAEPLDYYALVDGAAGRPGIYEISSDVVQPRIAGGIFSVDYTPGHAGCKELVAKSFKRNASNSVTTQPVNAKLSFFLPGPTRPLLAPPTEMPGLGTGFRGWVDLITRQRGDPREGRPGADGVADWVQMRAWDIYTRDIPPGGELEPVDADQTATNIRLLSGEPAEVFGTVRQVSMVLTTAFAGAMREHLVPSTVSATAWTVSPEVVFSVSFPAARTDAPADLAYSELTNFYRTQYSTRHYFYNVAAHEARHAWQSSLRIRSNSAPAGSPQFVPPSITVEDSLAEANAYPDNNDDRDCLPERAFLSDGRPLDGPTGSAGEIVDQGGGICEPSAFESGACPNREFGASIRGDAEAENCDPKADVVGSKARERDASRFARAIEP